METQDFHQTISKRKYIEQKFSKRHTDPNLEMETGVAYNTLYLMS